VMFGVDFIAPSEMRHTEVDTECRRASTELHGVGIHTKDQGA
jgi:hypothetical protein